MDSHAKIWLDKKDRLRDGTWPNLSVKILLCNILSSWVWGRILSEIGLMTYCQTRKVR
jgi:hypothetical protein